MDLNPIPFRGVESNSSLGGGGGGERNIHCDMAICAACMNINKVRLDGKILGGLPPTPQVSTPMPFDPRPSPDFSPRLQDCKIWAGPGDEATGEPQTDSHACSVGYFKKCEQPTPKFSLAMQ